MAAMILLAGSAVLAASQLDQQQTETSSGSGLDANFPQAQTFTAGLSGSLTKVSVHARLVASSGPGDLRVSVQTLDGSGFPSGTVLGSGSVPVGDFTVGSLPGDWVDIDLSPSASVSAGTKYALVVSSANAPEDNSHYVWAGGLHNPYSGGDALGRFRSGEWFVRGVSGEPMDFAFKTFVEEAPTCFGLTPTMTLSDGPDNASGTRGADVIVGLGGNDTIRGLGGNDKVCGGDGRDDLSGGPGGDKVDGGRGSDFSLKGEDGADLLKGGPGSEGGGASVQGGPGDDKLYGQGGNDVLIGDDFAAQGDDVLDGGGEDDTLDDTDLNNDGVVDIDALNGGPGDDNLDASDFDGADFLDGGTHVNGDFCADEFDGVDNDFQTAEYDS